MDAVVNDESIIGENVNLISPDIDETQPVDISPEIPQAEEEKQH